MRMLYTVLPLLISVLYLSNPLFATTHYREVASETPIIKHVIAKEEGVFLLVGDEWIVTQSLQASGEGILILVEGEWMTIADALENPECARATWTCGVCHFINYVDIVACAVCGTPRSSKKRG